MGARVTATTVAIVGAGPSGLTLANLLHRCDVPCVVVERQSIEYVRQRQRAGVLEYRARQMFQEWGLADRIIGGASFDGVLEFRVDGQRRLLAYADEVAGRAQCLIPQQVVVQRLIAALVEAGGDLRFNAAGVAVHDVDGPRPRVTYRSADGMQHAVECQFVAGCDGYYGPSRMSVPPGVMREYSYDHGIGWLTVLADASPPRYPLIAISEHGYAGQFARGPRASRFYLQCPPTDDVAAWPDDRVWEQLRLRLADADLPTGPITEKRVLEMRSAVFEPMSYGRLYLVGDAAHVITPIGGKGMNLALYDADMLARALRACVREGSGQLLREYSATCLRRVWRYQEFARWMSEMVHDAGDDSLAGPFRRQLARARLEAVLTVPATRRMFAEYQIGVA